MNNRIRQKLNAYSQQTVLPIMATLENENDKRWHGILFIDPRDWDKAKSVYGDRLQVVWQPEELWDENI